MAVAGAAAVVVGATFVARGEPDETAVAVRSRPVSPPALVTTVTTLPASSTTMPSQPAVTTSTRRPVTSTSGPHRSTTTTRPLLSTTTVPSTSTTTVTGCPVVGAPVAVDTDGHGNGWMVGDGPTGQLAAARTVDGGQTWIPACLPEIPLHHRLEDVTSFGPSHVWAVGAAADGPVALYSHDAGRTWERGAVPNVGRLQAVSFADADHGWAVGGGYELDSTGDHIGPGIIVATKDGGRTWQPLPLPGRTAPLIGVAFADQHRGWAVGRYAGGRGGCANNLLATMDGGATWTSRPLWPGPSCELVDVAVIDDTRIAVVGWWRFEAPMTSASVAAISDDGGLTWKAVTEIPNMILWKVEADGGRLMAVGQSTGSPAYGGGVIRSDDGGMTWTKGERFGPASLRSATLFGTSHGWATTNQEACLFVTRDGGATWEGRPLTATRSCPRLP